MGCNTTLVGFVCLPDSYLHKIIILFKRCVFFNIFRNKAPILCTQQRDKKQSRCHKYNRILLTPFSQYGQVYFSIIYKTDILLWFYLTKESTLQRVLNKSFLCVFSLYIESLSYLTIKFTATGFFGT